MISIQNPSQELAAMAWLNRSFEKQVASKLFRRDKMSPVDRNKFQF